MGLATIDPHRKGTPTFTKSPSLVLIGLVLTEIQAFKHVKKLERNTFLCNFFLLFTLLLPLWAGFGKSPTPNSSELER